MSRAKYLYRADIRQRTDRPTNSAILQYVGRGVDFEADIYGYPEGTFFVVNYDDVPVPESLEEQGSEAGINVHSLPDMPVLKHAVVECLLAEAMVEAPELLSEIASPALKWADHDLREMQRKHTIACAKVLRVERIIETDLKLRAAGVTQPTFQVPTIIDTMGPKPFSLYEVPCPPSALEEPVVGEVEEEIPCDPCGDDDVEFDNDLAPGSETVQKAAQAIEAAREAELPQRLPKGSRRRITRMAPAVYIAFGDTIESRRDLCAGLTDGRAMGRKGREVAVISWDGEWPVVVRRYGKGGRVIYKVERALKKAGVEVA